jgi:hypothetical protein
MWDWNFIDVSSDVYNLDLSFVDEKSVFKSFLNQSLSKVQRRVAGIPANSDLEVIPSRVYVPEQFFKLFKLHLRKPVNLIRDELLEDNIHIKAGEIVNLFFEKHTKDIWKINIKIEGRYEYENKVSS